jgi:CheY-like chemotaxis protein
MPCLVLMDLNMPRLDSFGVLKKMRGAERRAALVADGQRHATGYYQSCRHHISTRTARRFIPLSAFPEVERGATPRVRRLRQMALRCS